jgi:hypothetical protein
MLGLHDLGGVLSVAGVEIGAFPRQGVHAIHGSSANAGTDDAAARFGTFSHGFSHSREDEDHIRGLVKPRYL